VSSRPVPEDNPNYELFIGLLTLISFAITFFIVLVPVKEVDEVLRGADTLICIIFLLDVARSLAQAPSKRAYMFGERPGRSLPTGVVDLLGSLPGGGAIRFLRVFRLFRIRRLIEGRSPKRLIGDFVRSRAEAAAYVVIIMALLVIIIGSSLIALVEVPNPDSNINTAGDALWWTFVTITTVGYGDKYPITEAGRLVGIITMAVGIGIFGVLTSFLAKFFLENESEPGEATPTAADDPLPSDDADVAVGSSVALASDPTIADELRALRAELAEVRRLLDERSDPLAR
jgi:voltage-gated potassium channel